MADALANVLLFVPLGAALAWCSVRRTRVVVIGFAVSLLVECCQATWIAAGRSPTALDLLSNSAGTIVGWCTFQLTRIADSANLRRARWLGLGYGTFSLAALLSSSWALGLEQAHRSDVTRSAFTYAPGYGWLDATPSNAQVNGQQIPHAGTGPIVAQVTPPPGHWDISVTLHGQDPSKSKRAIVFVHAAPDTLPLLLLAQHENDATLDIARRGTRLGLHTPTLVSSGAFQNHDRDCRQLRAIAHNGYAALFAATCSRPETQADLHVTPLLGWTTLLAVRSTQRVRILLGTIVWLTALVAPMGWWTATHRRLGVAWLFLFILSSSVAPRVFGLSPISLIESMLILVCFTVAFMCSQMRRNLS